MTTAEFIKNTAADNEDLRLEALRGLASRMDPKNPGRPPWAWLNLDLDEAAHLDAALDQFVHTYNRTYVAVLEDVIPGCWRRHPALAHEMPVQFWAWWAAHLDPKAGINGALDYYNRNLPTFQKRLGEKLLGKGGGSCRKNQHATSTTEDITAAISFDPVGHADYTHRSPNTRRQLKATHFGTLEAHS